MWRFTHLDFGIPTRSRWLGACICKDHCRGILRSLSLMGKFRDIRHQRQGIASVDTRKVELPSPLPIAETELGSCAKCGLHRSFARAFFRLNWTRSTLSPIWPLLGLTGIAAPMSEYPRLGFRVYGLGLARRTSG